MRERQRQQTRAAILAALARVVGERGVEGFTVQELADRAGVSYPSVYRHFPTRASLLEGLYEYAGEAMHTPVDPPRSLRRADEFVRALFSAFAENPGLVRGLAVMSLATGARPSIARKREERLDAIIEKELPRLDEADRRLLSALFRCLVGSVAYTCLTELHGLTHDEAAAASAWAVEALLESARRKSRRP